MSSNEREVSEPEQEGPEKDSVFDFLYHDVRRVGSFLAQFDDAGLLEKITQRESVQKGSRRGWKAAAGGSLPGIGGANISLERGPEKGASEDLERVYDPLWTNARTLLDFLTEREMIERRVDFANIGQFVLASGHLMILDIPMLKNAWEKPAIKNKVLEGQNVEPERNRQQRRSGNNSRPLKDNSESEFLLSLLSLLPHSLQANLLDKNGLIWSTLDENSIVGRSADLMLKHGALISGKWNMLGVLDAHPYDPNQLTSDGEQVSELIAGLAETPLGQVAARLAPAARQLLGRPPKAHGMTPLLIFREVNGSNFEDEQTTV